MLCTCISKYLCKSINPKSTGQPFLIPKLIIKTFKTK